jgi:hypothetical protein
VENEPVVQEPDSDQFTKVVYIVKGTSFADPRTSTGKRIFWVYTQPSPKPTKQSGNIVQSGRIARTTTVA